VLAFKPGDEVYGDTCHCGYGALAEYACADSGALALKPANLSFEEAAAVPQSALVALQGLRAGGIRAGQRVLVHGASGGIGTFAVQIARSFGAEVTGVCGPGNLELVASLGADRVLDYTKGDFLKAGEAYDLILAVRGTRPVRDYYGALSPEGSYVMAGGTIGRFLLTGLQAPRLFRSGGRKLGSFTHAPNTEDLDFLKQLIEAGKVRPVIDRVYPLRDAGAAFRHLQDGHARGRVVIRI
jgi:NADPH:quinone reductase-like Zn-dependent oxidoreductase